MPTRDRLAEFEAKRDQFEMETIGKKKWKKFMRKEEKYGSMSWIKKIQEMDNKLTLIKADVRDFKRMQRNLHWITNTAALQTKEMEIKNLIEQIISKSKNFERDLHLLSPASSDTKNQRKRLILSDTEQLVQSSQIQRLFRDLRTTKEEFKTIHADYVDGKKARQVKQRQKIEYPNIEENRSMVTQTATAVFNHNLPFSEEQNRYSEFDLHKEREIELQTIEYEAQEIHELFNDINEAAFDKAAKLVDNIEKNVTQASEMVEHGSTELTKAAKSKCARRKKTIICIISVIALVMLFIVIIVLVLAYNSNN